MLEAQENGTVTSVDATWTDCASIPDSSFVAGRKYLIIASGVVQLAASAGEHGIRLVHGTTPTLFTDSHQVYDPGAGANGRAAWQYMTVWTQPGTAELVKIQILREASTGNVTSGYTQVFAVDLTDLVENTDYWFNEETADEETTTTPTAKAAVTLTPNGSDDFWVIANAVYDGAGTTVTDGNDFEAELFESVGSTVTPRWQCENEDTDAGDENRSACLSRTWAALSNASHTFSVRVSHNGASSFTKVSTRIFALRLNAFDQHAINFTDAGDVPSTSPTWETEATISVTPDVSGNWFYLGSGVDTFSASTSRATIRLQDDNDGSMGSDPAYGDDEPGLNHSWDISDAIPVFIGKVKSLTSGGSRTVNFDRTSVVATATVSDRCMVAFSAELPAGGTPDVPTDKIVRGRREIGQLLPR